MITVLLGMLGGVLGGIAMIVLLIWLPKSKPKHDTVVQDENGPFVVPDLTEKK